MKCTRDEILELINKRAESTPKPFDHNWEVWEDNPYKSSRMPIVYICHNCKQNIIFNDPETSVDKLDSGLDLDGTESHYDVIKKNINNESLFNKWIIFHWASYDGPDNPSLPFAHDCAQMSAMINMQEALE